MDSLTSSEYFKSSESQAVPAQKKRPQKRFSFYAGKANNLFCLCEGENGRSVMSTAVRIASGGLRGH